MIQRKQTLFLLAALILTVICLCMSLGTISPEDMAPTAVVTHWGVTGMGENTLAGIVGWACLVLSCPLCLVTVFTYKRRRMQMALTLVCAMFCALWYILWAYRILVHFPALGNYHMSWAIVLPAISFILYFLARHYIRKDEELVRSMDRIR